MAACDLITLQTPMMMPGCSSFSSTSLSWPMTCMFLAWVCMSNFAMRDLQPGLTEQAKENSGFHRERKRKQSPRERVGIDAGCLTSLDWGSWVLPSWRHGVEGRKSAGSWASSLPRSSTGSQKSHRTGTSSAHMWPRALTYQRPSAPRWRASF